MGCCLWGHTESDTTEATAAAAGMSKLYTLLIFKTEKNSCKKADMLESANRWIL